jgi:hypothetical protein
MVDIELCYLAILFIDDRDLIKMIQSSHTGTLAMYENWNDSTEFFELLLYIRENDDIHDYYQFEDELIDFFRLTGYFLKVLLLKRLLMPWLEGFMRKQNRFVQ